MKKKTAIRLLLAALAIGALALGILQDDFRETLQKAIYLCLECVGIG